MRRTPAARVKSSPFRKRRPRTDYAKPRLIRYGVRHREKALSWPNTTGGGALVGAAKPKGRMQLSRRVRRVQDGRLV
jgi:hypothetical protein